MTLRMDYMRVRVKEERPDEKVESESTLLPPSYARVLLDEGSFFMVMTSLREGQLATVTYNLAFAHRPMS